MGKVPGFQNEKIALGRRRIDPAKHGKLRAALPAPQPAAGRINFARVFIITKHKPRHRTRVRPRGYLRNALVHQPVGTKAVIDEVTHRGERSPFLHAVLYRVWRQFSVGNLPTQVGTRIHGVGMVDRSVFAPRIIQKDEARAGPSHSQAKHGTDILFKPRKLVQPCTGPRSSRIDRRPLGCLSMVAR